MVAAVGSAQVPIPSRSQKIRFITAFEVIIKRNGLFHAQEACWKHVLSQKAGLDVLKASKVFFSLFNIAKSFITIELSDGVILLSEPYLEALKRDSEIINNLAEMVTDTIPFHTIARETFLSLIDFLYDKTFPKREPSDLLAFAIAAHYLDCKKAQKYALQVFEKRIVDFRGEEDLEKALLFYKNCSFMPADLKKEVAELMAPYFGRVLSTVTLKNLNTIVQKYKLHEISALRFNRCEILYPILVEIYSLIDLKKLTLQNVSGVSTIDLNLIPRGVLHLKLVEFVPTGPGLGSALPRGLISLSLLRCKLSDADIADFPAGLKKLNLSSCKGITESAVKEIPRSVSSLNMSMTCIKTLTNCPSYLVSLNLKGCSISDRDLEWVNAGLKKLNISGCSIISFNTLLRFKELAHLEMRGAKALGPFKNFKKLEYLDASFTEISNEMLSELSTCLKVLILEACKVITDEGIHTLPEGIERLVLSGTQLTDSIIPALPPRIISLELTKMKNIAGNRYEYLPKYLADFKTNKMCNAAMKVLPKRLESLDISDTKVTSEGYAELRRGLKSLNIYGNSYRESDADYLSDTLESLGLSGACITDLGLSRLPRSLNRLTLINCRHIANAGMKYLPNLQVLNIACSQITDAALPYLSSRLATLNISGSQISANKAKLALPGTVINND